MAAAVGAPATGAADLLVVRGPAARPGIVGVVTDAEAKAFVDLTAVRMLEPVRRAPAREAG